MRLLRRYQGAWLWVGVVAIAFAVILPLQEHLEGARPSFIRFQDLTYLTFDELVSLVDSPIPSSSLKQKMERLFTTPIISNEAYYRGVRPSATEVPLLGPSIRIASWNIEKSLEIDNAITLFTDRDAFQKMVREEPAAPDSDTFTKVMAQRDRLAGADIVLLQEMDIGVKRSNYVDAAQTLAKALNMNYSYGAQYLEIDPTYLGLQNIQLEGGGTDQEATDFYRADEKRYKGLFGSAVLSRYPIKSVTLFPLRKQGYDWYEGEKEKTTFLEDSRRFGALSIFESRIHREMKVGGRNFMRVDLHVPGLPNDTLTIINIHLEIKCLPEVRSEQIEEILGYLKDIDHPVVMAGDFNSAPGDLSPTSVTRTAKRTLSNPTTWFSIGVRQMAPHAMAVNASRAISNVSKNFQNPTSKHIPVIMPNKSQKMFKLIENFRFDDGTAFDFRGDSKRSKSDSGYLSNSNERDRVGYKTTFQLRRTIAEVIGKYRLDWFFVKSFLTAPKDREGSYQLAPHFGETLEEMNAALKEPISDHHPSVIDLPFEDPKLG